MADRIARRYNDPVTDAIGYATRLVVGALVLTCAVSGRGSGGAAAGPAPTVLGFYLLVILNPTAPVGAFWVSITGQSLTFSFSGLVLASILYSLPFMVQPLATAFRSVSQETLEAAATLGASPRDQLISVVLPAAKRGFLTGSVLTFAHTVGEFGVVLMMGGNIPGETRVLSIAIYEHVETLNYGAAHAMALGLLVFSFVSLWAVYRLASQRVEVIRG